MCYVAHYTFRRPLKPVSFPPYYSYVTKIFQAAISASNLALFLNQQFIVAQQMLCYQFLQVLLFSTINILHLTQNAG